MLVNSKPLPAWSYIGWFQLLSHASTIGFSCILCYWWHLYLQLTADTFPAYSRIVSVALLWGWMHTIDLLTVPPMHAFVFMLKVIFFRDVVRFAVMYVFILLGFSYAIFTTMIYDESHAANVTLTTDIYQTFSMMFGMGSLFDDAAEAKLSDPDFIRLLFAIYICITTVVLLNILIAMMNFTYQDVVNLQDVLWSVEGLHYVVWIAQDNFLWSGSICRSILEMSKHFRPMPMIKVRDDGNYDGSNEDAALEETRAV